MKWKNRNLRELANIICGNSEPGEVSYFRYRSSSYLTEFFENCDLDYARDGSISHSSIVRIWHRSCRR